MQPRASRTRFAAESLPAQHNKPQAGTRHDQPLHSCRLLDISTQLKLVALENRMLMFVQHCFLKLP